MMQPPRQMRAIAPRSMPQPNSALAAAIWSKPWEYATTLEAYSASRTSSMNPSRSATSQVPALPGSKRPASRWGAPPDSARAKVASAMPVTGTPRSRAFCTVQRPVPFCSARSTTTSTNAPPVTGIAEATFARALSGGAPQREAGRLLPGNAGTWDVADRDGFIEDVRLALYASKVVAYSQGFDQIAAASAEFGWGIDRGAMARIWRGGCIIRARFLNRFTAAYTREPGLALLLADPYF